MAGIVVFFMFLGLSVTSCVASIAGGSGAMWLALVALVFSHIAMFVAGRQLVFRSPLAPRGERATRPQQPQERVSGNALQALRRRME